MTAAQGHAALTGMQQAALDALRRGWGEAYEITLDAEGVWLAARRDGLGGPLAAGGPDELWAAVYRDYGSRPVPRDLGPGER
jgi:hypothetical protein